jgi:L-threonylcarbamoyladenylate synthase
MENVQYKRAVEVLKKGGVVVFPTDTVWGVGALVSSKEGVEKLYRVKKRRKDKPTAILVSDVSMANKYGVMKKEAWNLAEKNWPGGLTLVVKAKGDMMLKKIRGDEETVGLRAPDHRIVQELLKELGEGIVTASANFPGKKAPKSFDELDEEFVSQADLIVDGEAGEGVASTVVKISGEELRILRQGGVVIQ